MRLLAEDAAHLPAQAEGDLPLMITGGGVADHRRSQSPGNVGAPAAATCGQASESIKAGSIHAANSVSGCTGW